MRKILISIMWMVFSAAAASAQTPMAVSGRALNQHKVRGALLTYPVEAKEAHVSGTVVVRVVMGPKGDVTEVKPVSGPALLRGAAVSCVKQWKFKPFRKDGKAVAATGDLNMQFSLGSGTSMTPVEKFLDRALLKYESEPALGRRGFSCEVDPKWTELPRLQLVPSDSSMMKWLEAARIRVFAKPMGRPEVEVKMPGEPKLNSAQLVGAKQALATGEMWIRGFSTVWYSYALTGVSFSVHSRLKKSAETTELVNPAYHGMVIRYVFDKKLLLTQILLDAPNLKTIKTSPKFEMTSKGWRYAGYDTTLTKAGRKERVVESISYQVVGDFYLPKMATVPINGGSTMHFEFRDCKVNPPIAIPPPIRVNKNTVIVHIRPH